MPIVDRTGFAPASACPLHAGVAQLVERQLPKLNVAGSNPVSRSNPVLFEDVPGFRDGREAERRRRGTGGKRTVGVGSCSSVVEHSLGKGEVDGSIPSTSSKSNQIEVGSSALSDRDALMPWPSFACEAAEWRKDD
jgi:hypothetical protein